MKKVSHRAFTFNGLLFGVAIMPLDAPISKRLEVLSKYVTPAPGNNIEILPTEARDQSAVIKDMGKLYGEIRVAPPKGACFIVTTDSAKRDIEVCKPSNLKWRLEDLDAQTGVITWKIKTSSEDFGTEVKWPTSYSIAKTMPPEASFYQANSTPVFIKSCTPSLGDSEGNLRRITLTLFDGKQWLLKFPDKDSPIPPLDPPKPKVEEKPKAEGHGEPPAHGEEPKADEGHGATPAAKEPPKPEPVKEEEQWTINTRRGFEMSVGNFITDGSMPPGKSGKCRYVYDYIPGDNRLGRVECHYSDQYLYFYAFLRCMAPIIPKK